MNTIHINRPGISGEEINHYKDFQSILRNNFGGPAKNPFYRNIWLNSFVGIAIVSVVLIAFFILYPSGKHPRKQKMSFVNPPVTGWDVPYQTAFISTKSDTVLHFQSGSFVKIQKNSILDETNNPVWDSIEIQFREISSPAEIFLSGIPMEYDSAGTRSVFESAGMIDIRGFHNHRPVKINPERPLEISLVSKTKDAGYNLYFLDTIARSWTYMGKDVVHAEDDFTIAGSSEVFVNRDSLKVLNSKIGTLFPVMPELPPLADTTKRHFTLDLLKGEFPELDVFKKTLFEIDDSYRPLDKKHAGIVWESVVITKGNKPLTYFVDFKTKSDSCRYLVHPVIEMKDGAHAKALYDSSYRQYLELLDKRQSDEAKMREMKARSKNKIKGGVIYVCRSEKSDSTFMTVHRSFLIQNFGIWNCDRSRLIPNEKQITPVILLNDTIYSQTTYLADDNSNSLTSIYQGCPLKFNEKANNTLWMVTYDNKIAVFKADDFKMLPKGIPRCTLNMRLIKTPVRNAGDFIKLYKSGFKE